MHYVVSDIHGCYDKFKELLDLIKFSDQDILYVLGDVVDRGKDPVKVLRYMSMHDNIIPILGNHEYMMLQVLPKLLQEVKEDNYEDVLTSEFLLTTHYWFKDGGKETANAFSKSTKDERDILLDYVMDFLAYEMVEINDKKFFLSHSLPKDFHLTHTISNQIEEMVFSRPDFNSKWQDDITYIVGHTPTIAIDPSCKGKIYKNGSLIDIDCGCVFGYQLAALCLETMEEFYV